MAMKRTFGFATNDDVRAEQSETAIITKKMQPRRWDRCEAMANDEGGRKRMDGW